MFKQFKSFLTTSNAMALAIGVIIGAATGKMVTAVVGDILMPLISLVLPAGDWREAQLVLKESVDAAGKASITALKYGDLAGAIIDFLIISYVVYWIAKLLMPKPAEVKSPETKVCTECLEAIPVAARKCKFCGSTQPAVAAGSYQATVTI
jgi:large conductance mechanosensitive channel